MPISRRDTEGGSATTELVVLMPVVLMVVLLAVQFGVWLHARQVVTAAAQEGLAAAQVLGGTAESGRLRAEAFLVEAGGVRAPVVESARTATIATVEVRAEVPAVLPGTRIPVRGQVEGPVERFVPEPER